MKHYPPNGEPTTTNQHCQPLITNPKPTTTQSSVNMIPSHRTQVSARTIPPFPSVFQYDFKSCDCVNELYQKGPTLMPRPHKQAINDDGMNL